MTGQAPRGPFLLGGLAVLLLVPAGTLLVALTAAVRESLPFVVIGVLHLLALAYAVAVAAPRLRADRAWRPSDLAAPAAVAVGVGVSLFLTLTLATAVGIRGSALPRLRQGVAFDVDLPYVVATVLAVAALAAGAVAAIAPATPALTRHGSALVRTAGEPVRRVLAADAPGRPIRFVTGPDDPFLRRLLSPVTRVLAVAGAVASTTFLLVHSLADVSADTADLLTFAVAVGPVPAVVWSVLESLWRLDEQLGAVMAALWRTLCVSFVIPPVALAPAFLVGLVPPVWRGYGAQAAGTDGLVQDGVPVIGFVAMAALVSLCLGMVGGLAVSVGVVMPAVAVFRPDLLIGENQMSLDPADRRRNVLAVRLLAALLVMVFVFAIAMAGYQDGRYSGGAPLLALLVLVALTAGVFLLQRVDHVRRARSGTSARVTSPTDPPPPE